MIVGAINFSRHFLAFRNLSLQPYKSDSEGKAVLIVLGSSVALVTMLLWLSGTYPGFAESLRHSFFNVISIATTTGFVTENYETWPAFIPVWMLFLSCITCSTGSTGGGIKMFRTLLLVRQARRELKLLVHPSAIIPIRIGGMAIPDRVAYSVLAFIFLYFGTILVLTFAMLATGLDLVTAFSAMVGFDQQPRARDGRGRSGSEFRAAVTHSDRHLHTCHDHRPPGNLQRAGAVHRDVLAQVASVRAPLALFGLLRVGLIRVVRSPFRRLRMLGLLRRP